MPTLPADHHVAQWSKRFRKDPLASGVVAGLAGRGDDIWHHAFDLLQRESPEYRNAVDDAFARESKSHCNELLRTIVAIATGRAATSGGDVFAFVRTHAQWRARHGVPLVASLHAYRLAHRTYLGVTREPLLRHPRKKAALLSMTMLSDFWIELFDHVGAVLAQAHAAEEQLAAAQNTQAYAGLIDDLLRGLPPAGTEARRLSALSGIRPGTPMAVALLRPRAHAAVTTSDDEARLRSLARLLEQLLPPAEFGKLIEVRNGEVIAIVCSDGNAGRGLIEALRRNGFARRAANGSAANVGVSHDTPDIARLPAAVEEARLAADFAEPARPLMHFADIELPEYLLRRADDAAFRLVPDWVRHLDAADGATARELRRTIRAFADCNLNVKQTARRVGVHTNTVYFRLNRIKTLTGVDPRTYAGTSILLTVLRLREIGECRKRL